MKLYRLRDRLLDHWGPVFPAPNEKEVMASIANVVNSGDQTNALAQAPHHFEIYEVAKITDTEFIQGGYKTLVADCSSLVRGGVRPDTNHVPTTSSVGPSSKPGTGELNKTSTGNRTEQPTPAVPAQPEDWKAKKTNQ